ncbi:hypothetical protein ACEUAY_02995 [Aeromonas veronii]
MKTLRNYQPEIFGVIVALAVLNIWYLSSLAIDKSITPKSYHYFIQLFTVAIGGFIGAFSAFWLKKHEEEKKDRESKRNALNFALFVLIRKINAIQCIKKDLERYTTPFERGLCLPAMKPPDYSGVKQDINGLQFLIGGVHAHILMELTIEQERFEQAINSINIRNEFYVNEVQPALSFHSLNGRPLPLAEFEGKLGERLFNGAIKGAAVLYELVYACDVSLNETYTELREIAKKLFPDENFVAWENK